MTLTGERMIEETATVITKRCPTCPEDVGPQILDNFGIANSRPFDYFRNLYCKPCIRKKVTKSRRATSKYRKARRDREHVMFLRPAPEGTRQLRLRLSPEDHVKEAIRRGPRTQEQIATTTGLHIDPVGDLLARLLLWTREVKTEEVAGGDRGYVLVSNPIPLREPAPELPQREQGQKFYYGEEYLVEPEKESNAA